MKTFKLHLCPKCKKPMKLFSTGVMVKTFYCAACKEKKFIKRKEGQR